MKLRLFILAILATVLVVMPFVGTEFILGTVAILAAGSYFIPSVQGVKSTLPVDVWDALNATLLQKQEERTVAPSFLRSFFKKQYVNGLNVAFNTHLKGKAVAVDVNIQTKGTHHKRQLGKLTAVQPPLYWEYTDLQEKDLYTGIMADGSARPTMENMFNFASTIDLDLHNMSNEIDNAYELQCAQLLDNGIIQLNATDNINYGRSSSSIVNVTNAWNTANGDPLADLSTGAQWIRTNARNNSTIYHAIMGETAMAAFVSNAKVISRQNIYNMKLDDIYAGGISAAGGAYWGTVTLSSGHTMHIWSYADYYINSAGVNVPFINKDKVVVIPDVRSSQLTFVDAEVKALPGTPNVGKYRGFTTYDFLDINAQVHYFHLKGRGLAIPQEINEIYTLKVTNL